MIDEFWIEPDFYNGCAYGLHIHMRRNRAKAWCGYVAVPPHHPAFGGDEFYIGPLPATQEDLRNKDNFFSEYDLEVHGGISWSCSHLPNEPSKGLWWFGFDCSHYADLTPWAAYKGSSEGTYRTFKYALRECFRLAEQLSEFTNDRVSHPA